ncbi:MAG: histidinol dehydrogenase [Chitinophagaceae bacterium]
MQIFINPTQSEWPSIIQRPTMDLGLIFEKVRPIMDEVKRNGDAALRRYALQFDGVELDLLEVTEVEKIAAQQWVSEELKAAINQAAKNIKTFHEKQLTPVEIIETMPGVKCWRKSVGIDKVGLYIPGGTAPLFSTLLMLAIPAKLAGCKEIVVCTPPQKDGAVHPAVLYAASITGVTKIIKAGGAQAIAAMAYGTHTVPQVYKIFGPGNQFVTAAKQLVQLDGIAIDMPAGPSEVCVLADVSCNPAFVAADLLSQAEHGADSQVLLVSSLFSVVNRVEEEIAKQLAVLPRMEFAAKALENSRAIVMENLDAAIELVNAYAAEHLIICCENDEAIADQISNAGSIFLGNYSPESVGDYASGTNHTLPTNGYARMYSGVSVDSFVKKITVQKLTETGLRNIAPTVVVMAMAEGLHAHAEAVRVRMDN